MMLMLPAREEEADPDGVFWGVRKGPRVREVGEARAEEERSESDPTGIRARGDVGE